LAAPGICISKAAFCFFFCSSAGEILENGRPLFLKTFHLGTGHLLVHPEEYLPLFDHVTVADHHLREDSLDWGLHFMGISRGYEFALGRNDLADLRDRDPDAESCRQQDQKIEKRRDQKIVDGIGARHRARTPGEGCLVWVR